MQQNNFAENITSVTLNMVNVVKQSNNKLIEMTLIEIIDQKYSKNSTPGSKTVKDVKII